MVKFLRVTPFLIGVAFIVMKWNYSSWTLNEYMRSLTVADRVPNAGKKDTAFLRSVTGTTTRATTRTNNTFEPGSLNMTRLETLQRCYIDPVRYRKHYTLPGMKKGGTRCSFSSKTPKIAYYMIGKAGSTTARLLMRNLFAATENRMCDSDSLRDEEYHQFTLTREPTDRFWSAHSEMMKRWALRPRKRHKIPTKYRRFLDPLKNTKSHLVDLYETEEGQKRLLESLRLFIEIYDGEHPFDRHLRQQVPRFYNATTGRTRPLDAIYEVNDAEKVFKQFAQQADPPKQLNGSSTHANTWNLHLNTTGHLSVNQLRKLCHLSALDYCCLNYPLPEVCRGAFQCQWTLKPDIAKEDEDGLLIEALSPYPPFNLDN